jgi:hypothetical protein
VQADATRDLAEVIGGHSAYLQTGGMAVVISPRLDAQALPIARGLQDRGHVVSWMVVEGLEEPPAAVEMSAEQVAARMADRGVDAWTVAPRHELAVSMRRARRG